ncbi:MAG TPA: mechanosensitive ion channel family protein, partial [Longimicrobiales bacterium]|nr:mechanosensitive ion channel family protein [Longimicrobiales bacterium]
MPSLTELGERWLHMDAGIQIAIVESLLLVLFIILGRAVTIRVVNARVADIRSQYRWRKTITYVSVILAILLVGRVWSSGLRDFATFLGLATAGVAIALRDPIVNFGGWLFLIWRRPYVVGDRIQIGENAGDVIDIRVFQTIILEIGNWVDADQSTGRLITLPNGMVFRDPVANYTRGMQFIWNEIPVPLTFESNWRKAKEILTEIVEKHAREAVEDAEQQMQRASRQYMIFYSTLTPTVYTTVRENGVVLTLRYLCNPRRRRGSSQVIWEDILTRLGEHDDITFAYFAIRSYNRVETLPDTP